MSRDHGRPDRRAQGNRARVLDDSTVGLDASFGATVEPTFDSTSDATDASAGASTLAPSDDESTGDQAGQITTASDATSVMRIGRYVLEDELGRGGMGVVYRAHDPQLGRQVALKMVLAGSYARDSQRRRFLREARAVARLEHANIVEVYDMGEYESGVFYTMQYIDGSSLARRLADGPLPARQAARWCADIARALACAHAAGLVHRDVKPGNIMLDGDTPKLTDFGLVKDLDSNESTVALTRGGQVVGTPAYMAPEQLAGDIEAIGPATDQYALGIVLFEMISGRKPFKGAGSEEFVRRITAAEAPRLPVSGVPTDLDLIRRRAMASAIDERYPDCATLASDLERFLAGDPVLAASPGLVRRVRRLWRRHWRRAAVACAVALAVVGGIEAGDAWSRWQRQRALERHEAAAADRRVAMEEGVRGLLANGDAPAADELFAAFTEFENNRGTRALARAWLHHGQRLRERERGQEALDALAAAYASTDDLSIQRAALVALAKQFRAEYRWPQLQAVLATMGARTPTALDEPQMRALRRDAALATRDFGAAAGFDSAAETAAHTADGLAGITAALAQATDTEHQATQVEPWDIDGDGRPELALSRQRSPRVAIADVSDPTLPTRATIELPAGSLNSAGIQAIPDEPSPTALLSTTRNELFAIALGETPSGTYTTPYEILERWQLGEWSRGLSADLDDDGRLEHYTSRTMKLFEVVPGTEDAGDEHTDARSGWRLRGIHSSTNAAGSTIVGLVAADLDGDGRRELFVGSHEWNSYDIRVFRAADNDRAGPVGDAEGRDDDRVELVHRTKLGKVVALAVFDTGSERLLAALQVHDPEKPLNHRVFAKDGPQGEAAGIHLFAFDGERLVPRGLIPLPGLDTGDDRDSARRRWAMLRVAQLQAGDVDGDGRDELMLGANVLGTFVYRRNDNGSFDELALGKVTFLTLAQLDRDPAMELVVSLPERDHEVWVLGAGRERVPIWSRTESATDQLNARRGAQTDRAPISRRELRAHWQRAEDLNALGLWRAAADQMNAVATLAVGSVDQGRARYRAGEILAKSGALVEAGELYQQAASSPTVAAASWEAALQVYLDDQRWQQALHAASERLKLADPPEAVRATADALRRRLAAQPLVLDLRGELDPAWRVLAPIQIQRDRQGRGLRMATAGTQPLMELDLRTTGEPIRVAIDFELERMDWASYAMFHVVADGPTRDHFTLHYRGGGHVYYLKVACPGSPSFEVHDIESLIGRPLRLVWQMGDDGAASCEFVTGGDDELRRVYRMKASPLADRRPRLAVDLSKAPISATSAVLLQRIELTGFAFADTDETPLDRAHHALAMGRPDQALAALQEAAQDPPMRTEPRWLLARAMVAEEFGDAATLEQTLAAALAADLDMDGMTAALFRHHLDRLEEPLRAILGPRYYLLLWAYTVDTMSSHGDEGRMLGLLRRHANGLASLPADIGPMPEIQFKDSTTIIARIWLQVWRARAWRYVGRTMFAMRDLQGAQRLAGQLLDRSERRPGQPDTQLVDELRAVMFTVGRELASCYQARGEPERALDALLAALGDAASPEIEADTLAANAEFASLRSHPRWREITRVRMLSPTP